MHTVALRVSDQVITSQIYTKVEHVKMMSQAAACDCSTYTVNIDCQDLDVQGNSLPPFEDRN